MRLLRSPRFPWILCAAALGLLATSVVFALLNGLRASGDWGTPAYSLLVCIPGATFPIVGALIASGRPDHRLGWLFLAIGLGVTSNLVAQQYGYYALITHDGDLLGGRWFGWYGYWASFPFLASIFVIMLFPSGHLPSPRWRSVGVGLALAIAGISVSAALRPSDLDPLPTRNPVGIAALDGVLSVIETVAFPVLILSALAAAASMVIRFRRGEGIEREQIKWFALFAALLAVAVPFEPVSPLAEDAVTVIFAGLPAAAGIAILRYRLYDIDVVIRRTLVYGSLTAALTATYLLLVLIARALLPSGSALATAISTLAVAALFRPALGRIQTGIDRRFFRHRYDSVQTLAGFGVRVRDEVDLDRVGAALTGVVGEVMQPAHVSL